MIRRKYFPQAIKAFGNSMYPLLKDGDIVYLQETNFSKVKPYDVVCVKKRGKIFTHRALYKHKNYLITKGDASMESDGKVLPKQIIGKVKKIKRDHQEIDLNEIYLFQSTYYFEEIVKIAQTMKKKNINFIFLKGLPLHLYFEGAYPRKLYSDCDIMISPKDKVGVKKILIKQGFKKNNNKLKYLQRFIGSSVKEEAYIKIINGFKVVFDVHYEVNVFTHITKLPFPYLQRASDKLSEKFLKNKEYKIINGFSFPILNYNDLVIYLLLHMFGHGYSGIFRLDFIKTIITRPQNTISPDWNKILMSAKEYNILNFIIPGIYLLKEFYGLKEPYEKLAKLYPKNLAYSLKVFNLISEKQSIFNDMTTTYPARFKRAIFLLLLPEENLLKKLFYLFRPTLLLHLVFFIIIYAERTILIWSYNIRKRA